MGLVSTFLWSSITVSYNASKTLGGGIFWATSCLACWRIGRSCCKAFIFWAYLFNGGGVKVGKINIKDSSGRNNFPTDGRLKVQKQV